MTTVLLLLLILPLSQKLTLNLIHFYFFNLSVSYFYHELFSLVNDNYSFALIFFLPRTNLYSAASNIHLNLNPPSWSLPYNIKLQRISNLYNHNKKNTWRVFRIRLLHLFLKNFKLGLHQLSFY